MLRALLHVVVMFLFRVFTRIHILGHENLPTQGPALLASNHLHILDAPLVFVAVKRADLRPLVADVHRDTWWIRLLVEAVNGIWIHRGVADSHALRASLDHLRSGGLLGVAPEGTRSRSGGLLEAKTGVAFMADKAGAPIVPVAIWGTEKIIPEVRHFRRPAVYIHFGQPFSLAPLERANRDALLQRNTDEIMLRLAALLPESYRGVYRERVQGEKV